MHARVWHRRILTTVLALLATLAVSAQAQSLGAPVDVSATAATGYPVDLFVTLGDHYFAPDTFTIKVGQTVRFNLTTAGRSYEHDFLIVPESTTTILAGLSSVLPFATHATVAWTPSAPGTYRILCAVCPWMTGVIHVVS